MEGFTPEEGDRVRVDIPDETDPDHEIYHGRHGFVRNILTDDAGKAVGDESANLLYRVEFDDGAIGDFRQHDLRPSVE